MKIENKFYDVSRRAETLALYLIEHNATVRSTAHHFGISKSTVHKDLTEQLKNANFSLYQQAKSVLQKNKAERHLRGGEATRQKFKHIHHEGGRGTPPNSSDLII